MVNNLEGYAEYAVQKKLKVADRMPVVASVALMVVGLAIWTFIAGWVGVDSDYRYCSYDYYSDAAGIGV